MTTTFDYPGRQIHSIAGHWGGNYYASVKAGGKVVRGRVGNDDWVWRGNGSGQSGDPGG